MSGATYAAGTVINYAGTGNDVEDGTLPASAFTWWVDLHHDSHTHPHVLPRTGAKTGSFTIPRPGRDLRRTSSTGSTCGFAIPTDSPAR